MNPFPLLAIGGLLIGGTISHELHSPPDSEAIVPPNPHGYQIWRELEEPIDEIQGDRLVIFSADWEAVTALSLVKQQFRDPKLVCFLGNSRIKVYIADITMPDSFGQKEALKYPEISSIPMVGLFREAKEPKFAYLNMQTVKDFRECLIELVTANP